MNRRAMLRGLLPAVAALPLSATSKQEQMMAAEYDTGLQCECGHAMFFNGYEDRSWSCVNLGCVHFLIKYERPKISLKRR